MNFNFSNKEYDLFATNAEEIIRLYGIPCRIVITDKVNKDIIFGDFSHFEANGGKTYDIYAMPENPEEFDVYDRLRSQFGIPNDTSINLFIAKPTAYELIQYSQNYQNEYDVTDASNNMEIYKSLISSIIILPSGRLMEIVQIDEDTPGTSNAFLFNFAKVCYKFGCREYIPRKSDKLDVDAVIQDKDWSEELGQPKNDNTLNDLFSTYFDELTDEIPTKQDDDTSEYFKNEDNIFNRFQ